jgi:phage-related protein
LAKPPPKGKKFVEFLGTSRKDLKALPKSVRVVFAYAIYMAEYGEKHPDAKPLTGFSGAGVMEVVEDQDGDAYRAVYTASLGDTLYVLHAFKKKSKVGGKTPPRDMELITKRWKEAQRLHSAKKPKVSKKKK